MMESKLEFKGTVEELEAMQKKYLETLNQITLAIEKEKSKDWRYSHDEKEFLCRTNDGDKLFISCVFSSWNLAQHHLFNLSNEDIVEEPLLDFTIEDECVALSLDDARDLVQYLTQKIEFMEGQ